MKSAVRLKFQFHDGSIKGESLIIDTGGKLYFNSTMVRLKASMVGAITTITFISIPRWFD